jgi:hypothetical protein
MRLFSISWYLIKFSIFFHNLILNFCNRLFIFTYFLHRLFCEFRNFLYNFFILIFWFLFLFFIVFYMIIHFFWVLCWIQTRNNFNFDCFCRIFLSYILIWCTLFDLIRFFFFFLKCFDLGCLFFICENFDFFLFVLILPFISCFLFWRLNRPT